MGFWGCLRGVGLGKAGYLQGDLRR